MAVVLLQNVANLRALLGYDSGSTDVDNAIRSALEKATATLEGSLRTQFTRGVATDTFMARNIKFAGGTQRVSKLKLSRGFLDEAETITAIASASLKGLDTDGSFVNLRANVDNENFDHLLVEDAERGRIMFADYSFGDQQLNYVRVSYTCGYATAAISGSNGGGTIYDGIPGWLTNLAETQAELNTFTNPTLNPGLDVSSKKVAGEPARVQELRQTLETMLQDHVCYAPGYAKAWQRAFTAS